MTEGNDASQDRRALYLRWRPRTFTDVVSQGAITLTLKNAVLRGTAAHATLVVGGREQNPIFDERPFALPDRARAELRGALAGDGRARLAARHAGYRDLGVDHERLVEIDHARRLVFIEDRLRLPGQLKDETGDTERAARSQHVEERVDDRLGTTVDVAQATERAVDKDPVAGLET